MAGRIAAGVLAGLIATAVLSILLVLKAALDIVPELSFIALVAEASARVLGTPRNLLVGWLGHLLIGTLLWGSLYALTNPLWRQGQVIRGIQFGVMAWLLMMVVLMPLAGVGLFGLALGPWPMLVALVFHVVYGAILGHYFGRLMCPIRGVPRDQNQIAVSKNRRAAH